MSFNQFWEIELRMIVQLVSHELWNILLSQLRNTGGPIRILMDKFTIPIQPGGIMEVSWNRATPSNHPFLDGIFNFPPLNHPFLDGIFNFPIFSLRNHPAMGVAPVCGNPHLTSFHKQPALGKLPVQQKASGYLSIWSNTNWSLVEIHFHLTSLLII